MDQEISDTLNLMKIEAVIIKGKISGIKKSVQVVMDPATFNEWRGKLETKEDQKKKIGFGEAFIGEAKNLIKPKKKS